MEYLIGIFKLEAQSIPGGVRFLFTLVAFPTLLGKFDTWSGRQGFTCRPKDDNGTARCFLNYSADMSLFCYPKSIVLFTAVAQFILWGLMLCYSYRQLKKIRRTTDFNEKKQLCHELWETCLHHVCCELVVNILILIFFCSTQKISLPETYSCTQGNESVLTCEDEHYWDKSQLNYYFIFVMALLTVLCVATIFVTKSKKECLIKDLLVLNTKENVADGSHNRNTQRNANEGSGRFTDTSNHNEQPVASVKLKDIDTVQVPRDVCEHVADNIGRDWTRLGREFGISEAHLENIADENRSAYERSMALFNKWRRKAGENATVGVLRQCLQKIGRRDLSNEVRDIMRAKKRLPLSEEVLSAWNTETDHADPSWQSTNLTRTTSSEWATANSSVSASSNYSIRHRNGGGDSDDSEIQ